MCYQIRKEDLYQEKQIRINTADLPKGHYVLKIIHNDSVISKQIMIK
ncbi:MAG: T9SS type A sorting domain-containing protein [Bacteroidetes bacterium]|nr:T9SS type A sorting domain-containing protein [Bacteroidota bacterium]